MFENAANKKQLWRSSFVHVFLYISIFILQLSYEAYNYLYTRIWIWCVMNICMTVTVWPCSLYYPLLTMISINLTTRAIHPFLSPLHCNIYTAQTTFILVDDILQNKLGIREKARIISFFYCQLHFKLSSHISFFAFLIKIYLTLFVLFSIRELSDCFL